MQPLFIYPLLTEKEHKYIYELFVENIIKKIIEAIDKNKIIIIVESSYHWKTIGKIIDIVKKLSNNVIFLNKKTTWLLSEFNKKEFLYKIEMLIKILKEKNIPVSITGINTSYCILETAKGISKSWIITEVPLWTTLNFTLNLSSNEIDRIVNKYWNYSSLLNFWGMPKMWSLTEYIEFMNNKLNN